MRLRALGLVTVAALTIFTIVATRSALAVTDLEEVVLCKFKEDPCREKGAFSGKIDEELKSGTVWELKAGSLGKVLCSNSQAAGETAFGSSETLAHGLITSLAFAECVRDKVLGGTEACTVSNGEWLPYLWLALLASDHIKYHVIVSKHETVGKPQETVKCGSIINCSFGAEEMLFEVLLNEVNNDVVLDVHQEVERSGGTCPSESVLNAEYLLRCLEPAGTFISCWPKMEYGSVLSVPPPPPNGTVLCKEDTHGGECFKTRRFAEKTSFDAELASATESFVLTSLGTVKCTSSKLSGKTTKSETSRLQAEIESLSFDGCTLEAESCTTTAEHLVYQALLLLNEEEKYHLIVEEREGKGKPQIYIKCGSLMDCKFGSAETLFTVELGEKDVSLKVAKELNAEGTTCPKTAKWEATYLLRVLEAGVQIGAWPAMEAPKPTGTALCAKDVKGAECPEGERFPLTTRLDAELVSGTSATITWGFPKIQCTNSSLTGPITGSTEATLETEVEGLSFSGCKMTGASCTTTVVAEHTPYLALLTLGSGEVYHLIIEEKKPIGHPGLHIICGSAAVCTYGAAEILVGVSSSEKGTTVEVNDELEREAGICPSVMLIQANYLLRALAGGLTQASVWPSMKP